MKGKVALVTGGAQGIGEAVARALAESGVSVAAVDQNEQGLRSLVTDLEKTGLHAEAFTADVGNSAPVEETVGMIERNIGPIDYLVNVAGVLRTGLITSLSDEDWEKTFSVNTAGVFHVSRSVAGRMITRRNGSIVTVGSNAAVCAANANGRYAPSKAWL